MAKRYKNSYLPSYYNTSSNAYDFDREIYERENERQKAEEQKRIQRQAESVKRKSFIHRAKFTVAIFFVFAGCIVTMASNATVDRQRVINNNLKDELASLKTENTNLQSKINDNTDLAYIEQEAKTRLGMIEPQAYQIVYIDVPKQSYTVQYEAQAEEKEEGFGIGKFLDVIKSVINLE